MLDVVYTTEPDLIEDIKISSKYPGPSGLVAGRSLAALEDPSSIPDAG